MKNLIALISLFVISSTSFAYQDCKPPIDLTKAMVRDSSIFGTADEQAATAMELGAASATICQAGDNLVVITQWEIISGSRTGQLRSFVEVFSK